MVSLIDDFHEILAELILEHRFHNLKILSTPSEFLYVVCSQYIMACVLGPTNIVLIRHIAAGITSKVCRGLCTR